MKLARKTNIVSNSSQSEADVHVHPLVPGIKSFSKYMGFAVLLTGLLVISWPFWRLLETVGRHLHVRWKSVHPRSST